MKTHSVRETFQLPGKSWWVYLTADDGWAVKRGGEVCELTEWSSCTPLLPLLEIPHKDALTLVRDGLRRSGADPSLLETFPFGNVLHMALAWETAYWRDLAVGWLEDGYALTEPLVDLLRRMPGKRHFSQRLRHRALRLVVRHERAPGGEDSRGV